MNQDERETHIDLGELWKITQKLEASIHPSKRPSPLQIVTALGD